MRIDYECSGGFGNLQLAYQIDTENLQPELAKELHELVESCGVFEIDPEEVSPQQAGPPDVFYHKLYIASETSVTTLAGNDVTLPARLQPLLSRLRELAIQQRLDRM